MESRAANARAALEAARAVFSTMTGMQDASFGPPAAREFDASALASRAVAAANSSSEILRSVTGRDDLEGQALVSEARRMDFLTLGDAHALVALYSLAEGRGDRASADERSVEREALLALEHAVATLQREAARGTGREGARGPAPSAVSSSTLASTTSSTHSSPSAYMPGIPVARDARTRANAEGNFDASRRDSTAAGAASSSAWSDPSATTAEPRRFYQSAGFLIGIVALVVLAAAGGWYAFGRASGSSFDEAASAYSRGSRETARIAFARLAQENPDDARPLIYLGRMARETGDLAEARRFLDRGVRLAPNSALAQREMGSVMLAEGNTELARRFYVRSLEIDAGDRLAQGLLACSLHKLGRVDEAARWSQRAGAGEWTPCLSAAPGKP